MGPDCYVGLDLGTSGCRAIAVDSQGRFLAESRVALPASRHGPSGASEQDPHDWWLAVVGTLRALTARKPGRVVALSVDGTSSTLLLCDAAGQPLTPALMYDDRQAGEQAGLIEQRAPGDSPARGSGSALSKLLYLIDRVGPGKAKYALHQADWINGKLTGKFGISDENNALKLGYDPLNRRWPAWLSGLSIAAGLLPHVVPVGTPLGPVAAEVARTLGLAEGVMLVAGTTDSIAATLAAGLTRTGDALTSLGSTLVLKLYNDQPLNSSRYGVYSHRFGDGWLAGGASNCGGAVLRQFFNDTEIARLSRQIDPGRPLGLGYYPLPGVGERFPRSDPEMQARMEPRPNEPHEFLQAILEGIADIEAEGYARLVELGATAPVRVFTSGGGAVNETWRRIRERRLGIPVLRARQTEAAFGSALLALQAMSATRQPCPDQPRS